MEERTFCSAVIAEKDAAAFYEKNNKAAGTKLRGTLQVLKLWLRIFVMK